MIKTLSALYFIILSALIISCSNTANDPVLTYTQPVGTISPVLEWQWTSGSLIPASKQVMSIPLVINLNDDNDDGVVDNNDIPDIVFQTFASNLYTSNGTLRAINGDGSGDIFTVTGYETSPGSSPAAGDIDGDGLPEIIAVQESPFAIMAFENDGTHKWTSTEQVSLYLSTITLADIDMDGSTEIICGSQVLNSDGSTKWKGTAGTGMYNSSTAVNLDMSGDMEVLAGNTAYRSDGSIYWQNTIVDGYAAAGNFDSDEYPEIVNVCRGSGNTTVYMVEHDGQLKWGPLYFATSTTGAGAGAPSIADLDNDGNADIVFSTTDRLYALQADGSVKWSNVISDPTSGIAGVSIFDLDGCGIKEVIFADQYYLRIYSGDDGEVLSEIQVGNGTLAEIPVIADVDNDNQAEIVVAASNYWNTAYTNGILVFGASDESWFNTRKIWNQAFYHVTNINDDFSIPQVEENYWNTSNTCRSNILIPVTSYYDVSASHATVDTSGSSVTVRIGNGSMEPVSYINVALYNGDPDAGGTLIDVKSMNDVLSPGADKKLTFTWTPAAAGSYCLYLMADDDGYGRSRLHEVNEDNNKTSVDVVIE